MRNSDFSLGNYYHWGAIEPETANIEFFLSKFWLLVLTYTTKTTVATHKTYLKQNKTHH